MKKPRPKVGSITATPQLKPISKANESSLRRCEMTTAAVIKKIVPIIAKKRPNRLFKGSGVSIIHIL
jgi:hypothetical protein